MTNFLSVTADIIIIAAFVFAVVDQYRKQKRLEQILKRGPQSASKDVH